MDQVLGSRPYVLNQSAGVIEENQPAGVTFNIPNLQPNQGKIDLGKGSTIRVANTLVNNGVINGTGTVAGNLINNGTIDMDGLGPIGLLTVTGALVLNSGGTLNVDINYLNQMNVVDSNTDGGSATSGGNLVVDLLPNYIPAVGDTFQIITSGGLRTCVFQSVSFHNEGSSPPPASGDGWYVEYDSNDVILKYIDLTTLQAPSITQPLGTTSGDSSGGTSVTITGTNFTDVEEVLFGT
jgi:hypothetical protein